MIPREIEYCPFCGSDEIERAETVTRGPETYYDCPTCGRVGTTGIGVQPSS
ncbi:hypothetical protein [Natronolimnohabitans innermongolicus]|uniref:Small CPxCG-related zinc finger protein n=1 Tax=Natronolimnohabitans innermongolicus JCM 12255 TaxID=1227499 RepID=L9X7P2_9EURY|nr:hypothetical protein [Natronolimnohabitans innermongolicus]ELY57612.1 hypothetical protein C493_09021 [Natronolimnohabitans innermongolicus JCM 12255]